jgi:tetratricopeptide (TPR) repeat protein
MNIIEFLWNPLQATHPTQNETVLEFIADCKELRFNRLFTTRNNYSNTQSFKNFNALFRVFALKAKYDSRGFNQETIAKVIELLTQHDCVRTEELTGLDILNMVLYCLHGLYLKENWTGPSYLSPNANKAMKDHLKVDHSTKYHIDLNESILLQELVALFELNKQEVVEFTFDKFKSEKFIKVDGFDEVRISLLNEYLMVDGEDYCHQLKLLELFIVFSKFYEFLGQPGKLGYCLEYELCKARCYNLHSQIMDHPAQSLKTKLHDSYSKTIELFDAKLNGDENLPKQDLLRYCCINIEFALSILSYFEYSLSKKLILKAMNLLGIEIRFTGKLGIKTKYQSFKVPQLIVEISRTSANGEADDVTQSQLIAMDDSKPVTKNLDEIFDNILHEKPVLEDLNAQNEANKPISLEENLIILALIENLRRSTAYDDMLREQIMAYLLRVIDGYHNWSITVAALAIRSQIEFSISKKMERAMLQYEQIFNDWHSKKCPLNERMKFVYAANFPNFINIISSAAENYKKIACYMTAAGLFKDIGLLEESIVCMTMGQRKDQALDMIKSLPEKFAESPKMLCALGDIYRDIKYFEKAIEKSNGKYVKAFRALARFYFQTKDYSNAEKYFREAVALNDFNLECWMNLGYIYLVQNNVDEAIEAYKKAVWIDDGQSIAWANLANFYKQQGKVKLAFEAMEKAIKSNDRNWQMWFNMVIIAFENKNFSWFIRSCLKLIELDHPEQLKDFILAKFVFILEHLYEESKGSVSGIRQIELLTEK